MFYDTEAFVLNGNRENIAKIMVDLQPYDKTMQFEENIEIAITARVFCDKNPCITLDVYLKEGDRLYKIMSIKEWSTYLECYLYLCKGDSDEAD